MSGEPVFLTGATGFVGGHVARALLDAGYPVTALARRGSHRPPELAGCRWVEGDLRRPGELVGQLEGCRYLVHVAACYSFAPARRGEIWATNVTGTAGLLEAARLAGVERAVVTSSSATAGPARDGRPATEADHADPTDSSAVYHRSKVEQERAALASRLPVVLLLPTTPVGPGDRRPTPTGKLIVDFMHGRMFGYVPGGMNLVPVEDVARAHVLALSRGRPGERYLLGGDNRRFTEIWATLAELCGRPAPRLRVPYGLALALGWADELRCRLQHGQEPLVPLEGVAMSRHYMFATSDKARAELGFAPGPSRAALARAVEWFRDQHDA
ncbi:MAG TPA: NAD-dependent epimerase/dehydratase family protein [Thermomicrobiaceae bacterium]|nr:NAD-dependent epimerase/dehydratase family protein [Thermomicrobiaceae bacterium]